MAADADGEADDTFFGNGRVEHPLRPELIQDAVVVAVNTTGFGDVLAGDKGVWLLLGITVRTPSVMAAT